MKDQEWFNTVAGIVVVLVVVGGAAALLAAPTGSGTSQPNAGTSIPTAYRNLTISYVPSEGGFDYSSLELSVPLHVRVVFTITNFDPSTAALPTASDAQVSGTYDGAMSYSVGGTSAVLGQLPAGEVSHTFSMSNAFYHLNVPVPAAPTGATPVRVVFSVVFDTPGTFTWGCVALCDPAAMDAAMWGHLTVA